LEIQIWPRASIVMPPIPCPAIVWLPISSPVLEYSTTVVSEHGCAAQQLPSRSTARSELQPLAATPKTTSPSRERSKSRVWFGSVTQTPPLASAAIPVGLRKDDTTTRGSPSGLSLNTLLPTNPVVTQMYPSASTATRIVSPVTEKKPLGTPSG